MSRIRLAVGGAILAAAITVSAQAPAQPSTTDKVKSWTQKKWNAAKHEYAKDKVKWDACNKRATERHLTGRKSWSFVYDCMKS
jgi:hypothetical protein